MTKSRNNRLLAIGDIHGQRTALELLLEMIQLSPDDRLVLLGDYVDSGDDSAGVLDVVAELLDQSNVIALRGNHEDVMLNALDDPTLFAQWAKRMGRSTVESYNCTDSHDVRETIRKRHATVLQRLRLWHEEAEAIFVHACVDHALPMEQQSHDVLLWQKMSAELVRPHMSEKVVICGHSAQRSGVPSDWGWVICIDTDAKRDGWLTCLDVNARWCWQARKDGARREFQLGFD